MPFDLPRPGAPVMDNCIATLLVNGNSSHSLKPDGLDRIAEHQGFDPSSFRARFAELETAKSLQPRNYEESGK